MNSLDYWRICEDLTVFQAIMLILEYDPAEHSYYDYRNRVNSSLPVGYIQ